jgi:hypothetical protein
MIGAVNEDEEMEVALIVIFAGFVALLMLRGDKIKKSRENVLNEMIRRENHEIKKLSYISYHGGLGALPKPQKLSLFLSDEYLMLMTNKGQFAKLPFNHCCRWELFDTKVKNERPRGSMLPGMPPFSSLKREFRHFIVAKYVDAISGDENNHVLIEHDDKEQRDAIFAQLFAAWDKNRRKIAAGT